jgi:hypothetical protein
MSTSDGDHAPLEALSAFLDGEAPELASHVERCQRCLGELSRLREVATAVGGPVPPPSPAVVDRAVARALDAAGTRTDVRPPERPPAPLRRSRTALVPVACGSIAAVLLTLLVAAAVFRGDGRGRDGGVDTALAPGPETAQDRSTASRAVPGGPVVSGGDLGEVGGPGDLAGRLSGRIPGTAGAPAAMAARPDAGATGSSAPSAPAAPPARCEAEARAAHAGLGRLVYTAEGLREGRPVVVLGFGSGPVTVMVLTSEGCDPVFSTEVP